MSHQSRDELQRRLATSRARCGLPPTVEDQAALAQVAALLGPLPASTTRHRPAAPVR